MNEMILLKLGELVLKGLNRRSFEDKLSQHPRRLNGLGQFGYMPASPPPMWSHECGLRHGRGLGGHEKSLWSRGAVPGPAPVGRTGGAIWRLPGVSGQPASLPLKPFR